MNNYDKCFLKEKIEKHKQILKSEYGDVIYDLTDACLKTNDLLLVLNEEYIIECKSDTYCNDHIVVELVANFRSKNKFRAGFYDLNHKQRKELEQFVIEIAKEEHHRSTALFTFLPDKKYLFSYRAGDDENKSYYLLDLVELSKWVKSNWRQCLLLVNTDDSCSCMVKLPYDDFKDFLILEKQNRKFKKLK